MRSVPFSMYITYTKTMKRKRKNNTEPLKAKKCENTLYCFKMHPLVGKYIKESKVVIISKVKIMRKVRVTFIRNGHTRDSKVLIILYSHKWNWPRCFYNSKPKHVSEYVCECVLVCLWKHIEIEKCLHTHKYAMVIPLHTYKNNWSEISGKDKNHVWK